MAPIIKLYNMEGQCKKIPYPENFGKLIEIVKEFVPSNDNTKRYQLIELKANREIINEEDFKLMTDEYVSEKVVKININIVDNNSQYIIPENNYYNEKNKDYNIIINESNISINAKNKREEYKNNSNNSINAIVKKKLKELEDKLVDELYNNSMMEIEKSKIMNNYKKSEEKNESNNIIIHKGITCNKCGKEIIGERFKCVQCQNFNLCEICEHNYNHDMSHIMISIIYPIQNEKEFNMKLDKNLSYRNKNMNYDLEPKIFYLNREGDFQSQEITVKNTGSEIWKNVCLKCVENKSEIIGDDCIINQDVSPGNEFKTQVNFFNIENQLEKGKIVYYSFFEMFTYKNESFGNVSKIKIIINNSIN